MALPKHKVSKQRRNKRASANLNLTAPTLAACPHCHEPKVAHRACTSCGYYDGKAVIEIKQKKAGN